MKFNLFLKKSSFVSFLFYFTKQTGSSLCFTRKLEKSLLRTQHDTLSFELCDSWVTKTSRRFLSVLIWKHYFASSYSSLSNISAKSFDLKSSFSVAKWHSKCKFYNYLSALCRWWQSLLSFFMSKYLIEINNHLWFRHRHHKRGLCCFIPCRFNAKCNTMRNPSR